MSNKIFFNLDNLFISVGIDVGADFSWMSIALPNQQFVGHLIHTIREIDLLVSFESTGLFFKTPLFHRLHSDYNFNFLNIPPKGII